MDIISVHYKDIRKMFVSRSAHHGIQFSDDSFNDAFIKCAQHFGNEQIAYDDAVKYFWVSYNNTVKGELSKCSKTIFYDEFNDDIVADDDENDFAKYVYDTVMDAITEAFGEDDMHIYSLYKYNGWSKQELINEGYDCKNFEIRIKNIHRFVKDYIKLKYKIK